MIAKLTPEQRTEIREAYASGRYASTTLGARYGVHPTTIRKACRGITPLPRPDDIAATCRARADRAR